MRFDPYRSLSDAELDRAIKTLAMQLASGATQISSPDAGSVGYSTPREAERTLMKMERSRCRRLGLPFESGQKARYTNVYIKADF